MSSLLFPDGHIPYGDFASLVGRPSLDTAPSRSEDDRDVYLLGVADGGLQLARVALGEMGIMSGYSYFLRGDSEFSHESPNYRVANWNGAYISGTFASGDVFFSPYFKTFIMVYFNKMGDSTFYIRFLDLGQPLDYQSDTWVQQGKYGRGIDAEDVEALVHYSWSTEQLLYKSMPDKGGFNYAGAAHPEYFNRQYYPKSTHFYSAGEADQGEWYGGSEVAESRSEGDGRHLLISWTSQTHGGVDTGIYEIRLARVEFDDIPVNPTTMTTGSTTGSTTTSAPTRTSQTLTAGSHKPKHSGHDGLGKAKDSAMISAFLGIDSGREMEFWVVTVEIALLLGIVVSVAAVF